MKPPFQSPFKMRPSSQPLVNCSRTCTGLSRKPAHLAQLHSLPGLGDITESLNFHSLKAGVYFWFWAGAGAATRRRMQLRMALSFCVELVSNPAQTDAFALRCGRPCARLAKKAGDQAQ
jgi:hypothetical protein